MYKMSFATRPCTFLKTFLAQSLNFRADSYCFLTVTEQAKDQLRGQVRHFQNNSQSEMGDF